jgi:hypothetical protein
MRLILTEQREGWTAELQATNEDERAKLSKTPNVKPGAIALICLSAAQGLVMAQMAAQVPGIAIASAEQVDRLKRG